MTGTKLTVRLLPLVVTTAVALAGCGSSSVDGSAAPGPDPAATRVVIAEAAYAYPSDTLQDWVSYNNEIAVVRVTSADEIPVDDSVKQRGEWTTNRRAVLQIERVLWRGPGQPQAPNEVAVVTSGFVHKNGDRLPLVMHGAARLEPGERYVVPLALQDGEWLIPGTSAAPLVNGRVQPAAGQENPAVTELAAHTPDQVQEKLGRTQPDAAAARRGNLQPYERWQEVANERAVGSPGSK